MPGINKVILVGNVGDAPQRRSMPNGKAVTNITIATSESWRDKATGEKQERTEWHKVVFFNAQAEIVSEHVSKGDKLYVEGSLRTNKWADKNGQDRFTTEIVGKTLEFLSPKKPKDQDQEQQKVEPAKTMDIDEDDIPF